MGGSAKVCSICGQDCSNRPRVKSPEGVYACQACHDASKRTSATKRVEQTRTSISSDDIDLRSAVAVESRAISEGGPERSCPQCQSFMSIDQRVCVKCGYNRASNRKVSTRVTKEAAGADAALSRKRRANAMAIWIPIVVFTSLTVITLTLGGLSFVSSSFGVPFFFTAMGFAVVLSVWTLSDMIADDEQLWAGNLVIGLFATFIRLFTGFGGITSFALSAMGTLGTLWWVFFASGRLHLKIGYIGYTIAYIMLFAVAYSNPRILSDLVGK